MFCHFSFLICNSVQVFELNYKIITVYLLYFLAFASFFLMMWNYYRVNAVEPVPFLILFALFILCERVFEPVKPCKIKAFSIFLCCLCKPGNTIPGLHRTPLPCPVSRLRQSTVHGKDIRLRPEPPPFTVL